MEKKYIEYLHAAQTVQNDSERLSFLTSTLRSLLQTAVISSFEIAKNLTPSDEHDLIELTNRFCKPSDGLPLQILDTLTPVIRSYIANDYLHGWFESTKLIEKPLSKQLIEWVEFRNKRTGHGVLDEKINKEWASKTEGIIKDSLIVFTKILPEISPNEELLPLKHFSGTKISTPIYFMNSAVVILAIIVRKGIWKLKGQLLSFKNANEFSINLEDDNIFNTTGIKPTGKYELADIISNNNHHSFFHNIPVRQTDIFEGRKDELKKLQEWFDDEDSRYCLVYGDGGYGKTTLVLEMLNLFLESQYDFNEPLPTIISYHTAKLTRWTDQGLVHLTGTLPVMDECLRELVRCFHPVLSQEWYTTSGKPLIDKTIGVLKENKLTRNDVILIIDNTETLATNPQEVKDLGAFFKTIGKLIGRIIITSRRREFIEATPIAIEGLSEIEGVNLMKRLANEFSAKAIQQAGEAKLRKVSEQLMHKPILLEALVKYVARVSSGIDVAIDTVFKKSNEQLLEFLYEDAWQRMNQLQKEVFLTLIHLTSPLDQNTISRTCQKIGIQHTEFQEGLEETHFSVLTDYGRTYTIELVDLAKRFFLQQFSKLETDEKIKLKDIAEQVDSYAAEREAIDKEYKTDRIAEAFRSEYAKAAKVYVDKGDINNAIDMYKLAIEDDPLNSSLHDRFSWFLLNKTTDYAYAKIISEKAVELDKNNCDAIVGLALVNYRLGNIPEGDKYIDLAQNAGRSLSFCLLRKAIARYYQAKNEEIIDRKIIFLEVALDFLEQADRKNTIAKGYDAKNKSDILRYQALTKNRLSALRTSKTKMMRYNTN
ncbi:tetratricopeptide repeat protein [Klebsiella pneumoniae]|uniref:tetratricopeptide repeat protein n=1 Tax=Klebsiella pneumoniae complex TaxID=3390273 RepID=UPI0010722B97|nr:MULTISPECIES: ATP-binding protein [Klebsiella]EIX9761266.1 ATP-binding protein [Klebsiella pneumoniae]EKT8664164.1 ATP-binding protein [Klebsiella quasipneumoniae]ELA0753139.1 ATP-binding protein [Klebsiella quasipneumoniae]MBC5536819.1 ATP-binding protein [Klebsiella quasipneumoniae]MBC5563012.1 ATP-binding protein [Klebsiella quasipneumoniae]